MKPFFARHQRESIYHPATIGDIPQEVIQEAFIYLLPRRCHLVAPGEACRAFRPAAQELLYSRRRFGEDHQVDRFVCVAHLQLLVFLEKVVIIRMDIY
jgi:hypothetical protein